MNTRATERTAIFVVALSSFVAPLMLSAVNVAIPGIAQGLGADAVAMSWVPTAYLLASAVLLLPCGKVADMYGRKKVYLAGMFTITIASVLAASAESINVLITYRIVQGLGAAMLFATGVAILSSIIPRERRGGAIGLTVAAVYFGLTCGPLLGGWATHQFGWRSVFLVHIPLAVLNIAIALAKLSGEWKSDQPQRFDFAGSLLYGLSIVAFMYGLSILPAPVAMLLVTAGITGFILFFRLERRIEFPVFDVDIFFSSRVFTYSCLASLTIYSATFATSYLLSLYLQYIKGLSAQTAGAVMMMQPLMMALFSPLAGRLSDRLEPRLIASLGIACVCLGLLALAALDAETGVTFVLACLFLVGVGFAMFSSPNVNAIMGAVGQEHLGVASSAVGTTRVLGQMNSMAVVTVVFAVVLGPVQISADAYPLLMRSISMSFLLAAAISTIAFYFSLNRGNLRSSQESNRA